MNSPLHTELPVCEVPPVPWSLPAQVPGPQLLPVPPPGAQGMWVEGMWMQTHVCPLEPVIEAEVGGSPGTVGLQVKQS